MEITLSDKDMDSLATAVATKLHEKVLQLLMADGAWEVMSKKAKSVAELYLERDNFEHEAANAMASRLQADGAQLLTSIVQAAVYKVSADDPELAKTVRAEIFRQAGEAAARAARAYYQFDEER